MDSLEWFVEDKWKDMPKWFWWLAGITGFIILILLFSGGWLKDIISNGYIQPRTQDPRFVEVINNFFIGLLCPFTHQTFC